MKRRTVIILACALGVLALLAWYHTRPEIVVTDITLLWASEYDAYRQGSSHPGPGIPKAQMNSGEHLKLLWSTFGKDYLAFFVIRPSSQIGWILYGQPGIAPSRGCIP